MKRQEPESVGDVLRQTLERQGMTGRLHEVKAIQMWPAVVGSEIAELTGRPMVNAGVMTVKVYAAPLRNELNMSRSTLKRLINQAVGKDVITDIRFF